MDNSGFGDINDCEFMTVTQLYEQLQFSDVADAMLISACSQDCLPDH